jgi:hypothetical protein
MISECVRGGGKEGRSDGKGSSSSSTRNLQCFVRVYLENNKKERKTKTIF